MWLYDTTLYQIYPLGAFGCPRTAPDVEDEAGIEEQAALHRVRKLGLWAPYLQELGVGAVLLNPVFASGSHGYDTRGFFHLDCRLGTNDDLAAAVRELHAHGIRVVLDAVFNHVGRDFWAFRDVREHGSASPYASWFNISFDGDTHWGDGFWYEGWEGNQDLVKLNLGNPAVVDHLLDAVRMWRRDLGIDGLRLDVAYSLDRAFMRRLRELADELGREEGPDGMPAEGFLLIGEVLHGDYNLIVNDEMLHSCTNYECYKGLYSALNSLNLFEIAHSLHRQFGGDPWCIYQGKHLVSFADNHDVSRLASILTEPRHLPCAYGLLFAMPGVPCLYYGSEWGLTGAKGSGYEADFALRPALDAPGTDALLAPAQGWMDGDGPNELTAFIRALIRVRSASRALRAGAYRNVVITNRQLLFERSVNAEGERPAERVLAAVNADSAPFTFSDACLHGAFQVLFDSEGGAESRAAEAATREVSGTGGASGELTTEATPLDADDEAVSHPMAKTLRLTLGGNLEVPPFGVVYLRVHE